MKISKSQVAKINQKKKEIEQCLKDGMSPSANKLLRLRFREIDYQTASISMSLSMERARKSAENHNYSDFQASRGMDAKNS